MTAHTLVKPQLLQVISTHIHTVILLYPLLLSGPGQLRGVSRKEIKGNHPYSFALVRLTACMLACLPACVPWAMFMLCPAQDRIDSPTQHCALNQNLSRSGKPEPQSHSLSLLWIRPYGLGQHSDDCINRPKIASPHPTLKIYIQVFYIRTHQQVVYFHPSASLKFCRIVCKLLGELKC